MMTVHLDRRRLLRLLGLSGGTAVAPLPFAASVAAYDCPTVECEEAVQRQRGGGRPTQGTPPPRTGGRPAPARAPVRIEYTIWNRSDQQVRFRLPTGRVYVLDPGAHGTYRNSGNGPFEIYVFNTGRRYRLRSGNHRFFWNQNENRVGFNQNFDRN